MKTEYAAHGAYEPEFSDSESGKTNLTTLILTGTIITGIIIGGLTIGNYLCEKVIPQSQEALLNRLLK